MTQPTIALNGAGATFPYPVYEKWFINFQTEDPGTLITYDAIGSEAGVRRLLAGTVDFGASDSPEAIRDLAPGEENSYLLFPSVVGAVVPIVNVPGVPEDIAFTPEALAGIFLGKITKWNDPILKRANRGLHLPDLDIVVVHRADGSGTSYAFTDYLSKTSPEWKAEAGSSLTPNGRQADPPPAMTALPSLSKNWAALSAMWSSSTPSRITSAMEEFVIATANLWEPVWKAIAAAVAHSSQIRDDFRASIVDRTGRGRLSDCFFHLDGRSHPHCG